MINLLFTDCPRSIPIDNMMNWNEYFIRFSRTIKMKSAILYPYGPLRGNGCCRMLHVKHLAVTSGIYTLVSWKFRIYIYSPISIILYNMKLPWLNSYKYFEYIFAVNWIVKFFNYNFSIGVRLCRASQTKSKCIAGESGRKCWYFKLKA